MYRLPAHWDLGRGIIVVIRNHHHTRSVVCARDGTSKAVNRSR